MTLSSPPPTTCQPKPPLAPLGWQFPLKFLGPGRNHPRPCFATELSVTPIPPTRRSPQRRALTPGCAAALRFESGAGTVIAAVPGLARVVAGGEENCQGPPAQRSAAGPEMMGQAGIGSLRPRAPIPLAIAMIVHTSHQIPMPIGTMVRMAPNPIVTALITPTRM